MKHLPLAGRILLSLIWLWAALPKLSDPGSFAESILAFRLVPEAVATMLALYLPWLELTLALALCTRWHRGALALTACLMGTFGVALALAWARGLDLSCGCFGNVSDKTSFPLALARNFVLFLLSIFLLRQRDGSSQNSALSPSS